MLLLETFLLVLAPALAAFASGGAALASPITLVSNTEEFGLALADPTTTTILLADTLILSPRSWRSSVSIGRNVTISATEEMRQTHTYVLLDFNNMVMLVTIAPGCTLHFVGLEIVNHFDTVGPSFRPVRLSPGAYVEFEDCIQRRIAGLPYSAAVVNMNEVVRPSGWTGQQNCFIINDFAFNSTRSPGQPLHYAQAISTYDYAATNPPDRSLASQGLYYGGFTYYTVRSFYLVDNIVSQSCLEKYPGSECVALLLQQLAAQQPPPPEQQPQDSGPGSKRVTTIIAATVVPTVVLAAVLVAAAAVRARRLRAYGSTTADSGSTSGGGMDGKQLHGHEGDVESCGRVGSSGAGADAGDPPAGAVRVSMAPAATAVPAAAAAATGTGDGCVFWGLEEGQRLPEWSAEGVSEKHYLTARVATQRTEPGTGAAGSKETGCAGDGGRDAASFEKSSEYRSGGEYDDGLAGVGSAGGAGRACQPDLNSTLGPSASVVLSSLSHKLSESTNAPVAETPEAQEGARVKSGASSGGGEAAGSGGAAAGGARARPGGQGGGGAASGSGAGRAGPDLASELELMARGLRRSIKDVQLRLEGVIGSGAYGTVYKGIWQGLPVAVKTLVFSASAMGGAEGRRQRALQEAALCQSISHPNVIATYCAELEPLHGPLGSGSVAATQGGVGQAGGAEADRGPSSDPASGSDRLAVMDYRLYIVQEFADGGPLWRLYGRRDLWPAPGLPNIPAVVSLGLGIARALTHLHSKRIIHGDLNPNNVLLKRDTTQPSGFGIKVGDFGLSVMLPEHRSHLSNLRMGTMFYMCPSVVMKAQVGPASDVFSLGVMLWELYHGRHAGTRTEQGPRYCSIFPAFPPACPPAYSAIALHCLQRQPINRPTAAAVTQRLEALLEAYTL